MRRVLFFAVLLSAAAGAKTKKALGLLWGTALALGVAASPAGATRFRGTLSIAPAFGASAQLPFTGASSGTSSANEVTLPGGTFMGTASAPVMANPPITHVAVKIQGNGSASFTGDPLAGQMPLAGAVVMKGNLGGGPLTLVTVPLFTNHTPSSGAGGVGLGVGGSALVTIGGPSIYVKLFHTDWFAGMKTVTGLLYTYTYHRPSGLMASHISTFMYSNGTAMYTGTDARTPGGLGQLILVSPTKIATNLTGAVITLVALGSTLTLNFVPEPGTLLLLGPGIAGLAFLARRRMSRG